MSLQCTQAGSLRVCKLIADYKPYYSSLQECGTVLLGAWFPAFLSIVIPTSGAWGSVVVKVLRY